MTENYTTLSNVYSMGLVKSKLQGVLIGSFSTMPTASQSYLGQVIVFTGTSTEDYTQNHTYQCISDGEEGYFWNDITA